MIPPKQPNSIAFYGVSLPNGSAAIILPASVDHDGRTTLTGRHRLLLKMRVIAGTYRSRILKSLKGPALRPTSDRLRETLFNVLGGTVEGSRFVDVFAGTGAVGIEALSRGAAEAVFIEHHAPAAALIRRNLELLGIRSGATILASDALRGLEKLAAQARDKPRYHFVFVDPPYAAAHNYASVLRFLGSTSMLDSGARVIVEHRRDFDLPEEIGLLHRARLLRQGDAALSFFAVQRPEA